MPFSININIKSTIVSYVRKVNHFSQQNAIHNGRIIYLTTLPFNLRPTTHECVHLVMRAVTSSHVTMIAVTSLDLP